MYSDEASCSDCKLERIENKWNQLLLKWLNKCVNSKGKVKELNPRSLVDVINKYKHDICVDDIDRAILCTDDIEPFIRYKYPILRLRYLSEEKDLPKKLFIMTSILLFHCCINSQMGSVDEDICNELCKNEQIFILKFCERLNEMEVTVNNVECAIRDAYEMISKLEDVSHTSASIIESETEKGRSSSDTEANICSESAIRSSLLTIQSVDTIETDSLESDEVPFKEFDSSTADIPCVLSDTSTYSDFISAHNYGSELDVNEGDVEAYIDSMKINVYKLESNASKDRKQKLSQNKVQKQQPSPFQNRIASQKDHLAQNQKVFQKGEHQNVKEGIAPNKRDPHKKVSQIQSVAQNQKENYIQSLRVARKQSTDQNQTDAQKYGAVKERTAQIKEKAAVSLNHRVKLQKVVNSEVIDQLVTQQREAAATILNQLVTQQKEAAAAALDQLFTQQKEAAASVLNRLITQKKEETITSVDQRVTKQIEDADAIALKAQTDIQKGFAQKATITHKDGDVQADSKEISRKL